MSALMGWWNSRVPLGSRQLTEWVNEPVPNHLKRWWFCLGGTPAYLFAVQVVTGVMLALYYQPSAATAYETVHYITHQVNYGWYFRSLHKWSATFLIAAVILHQMRVMFTAAFRKPRELSWCTGMLLLLCTLGLGFTGYSLVFEQLSYWGATVGANICDTVPLVGGMIKTLMLGGDVYSAHTLPRLYVLHVVILPGMVIGLIAVHMTLVRLHGISELPSEGEPVEETGYFNFFPDHLHTELIIGMVLMVVLSALATVQPAGLSDPADPLTTPEIIKPEWFFYATFRWLKLFSATFAVLSMGLVAGAMFVWPWIDAAIRRWTRWRDAGTWVGVAGVLVLIGMTVWEAVVKH